MEAFETSSDAGNREWKSSSKVQGFELEMNEFESNSDAWNREWKFEAWNRECRVTVRVRVRVRPCRGCDPALIMNSILKTRTLHM